METMGKRLKWARKQARVSQEDLALQSGVTQGLVSKIERGDQDGTSVVAEFAFHCGVNARWLATGKGEPFSDGKRDNIALSPAEEEIVNIFRDLDRNKRTSLRAFAKHLEAESLKESLTTDGNPEKQAQV